MDLSGSSSKRTQVILVIIIIFVIIAPTTTYFALQNRNSSSSPSSAVTSGQILSPWVGRVAPTFSLATVNGGDFNLADYKNKSNVLLLFNEGLGCSPCLQQMQEMDASYATFKSMNVVIVGITADPSSDLATWGHVNKINNMIVISDQSLKVDKQYNTLGANISMMPGLAPGHTFILVDTTGIIRWRADYGPGVMYVQNSQIISSIESALPKS